MVLVKSTVVDHFAAMKEDGPVGQAFLQRINPPFMELSAHYKLLHGATTDFLALASNSYGHRLDGRQKCGDDKENRAKVNVKEWSSLYNSVFVNWNKNCTEGAARLGLLDSSDVGALLVVVRNGFSGHHYITVVAAPTITRVDLQDTKYHGAPPFRRAFHPDLYRQFFPDHMTHGHAVVASVASFSRLLIPTTEEECERQAQPVLLTLAHRLGERARGVPDGRDGSFKVLMLPPHCDPPVGLYWPTDIGYDNVFRILRGQGNKPYGAFVHLLDQQKDMFRNWFEDAKSQPEDMALMIRPATDLFSAYPRPGNVGDPKRAQSGTRMDVWQELHSQFLWKLHCDTALHALPSQVTFDEDDRWEIRSYLKAATLHWEQLVTTHPTHPHPLRLPITAMPFVPHYYIMSTNVTVTNWLKPFTSLDRTMEIPTKVRGWRPVDLTRVASAGVASATKRVDSSASKSKSPTKHRHNTRFKLSQKVSQDSEDDIDEDGDDSPSGALEDKTADASSNKVSGSEGSQQFFTQQSHNLPDERDIPTDDEQTTNPASIGDNPSSPTASGTQGDVRMVTEERSSKKQRSRTKEKRKVSSRRKKQKTKSRSRSPSESRGRRRDRSTSRSDSESEGSVIRRGRSPRRARSSRHDEQPLWERTDSWDRPAYSPLRGRRQRAKSTSPSAEDRVVTGSRKRSRNDADLQTPPRQSRRRRCRSHSSSSYSSDDGSTSSDESSNSDRPSRTPTRKTRAREKHRVTTPTGPLIGGFYSPRRSKRHGSPSESSPLRRSPRKQPRRVKNDSILDASVRTRDMVMRCPIEWVQATLLTVYSIGDRSVWDARTKKKVNADHFAFVREPTNWARKNILRMFDNTDVVRHSMVTTIVVRRLNTMEHELFPRTASLSSVQFRGLDDKFYARLFDANQWQIRRGFPVRQEPLLHILDFPRLLDESLPRDTVPQEGYSIHFAQQIGKLIYTLMSLPCLSTYTHRGHLRLLDKGFRDSEFGRVLWLLCYAPFVNDLQPLWEQNRERASLLWIQDFVDLFDTLSMFIQARQSFGMENPFVMLQHRRWGEAKVCVPVLDDCGSSRRPDHYLEQLRSLDKDFEQRWNLRYYRGDEPMWTQTISSVYRSSAPQKKDVKSSTALSSDEEPKEKRKKDKSKKDKKKDAKAVSFKAEKPILKYVKSGEEDHTDPRARLMEGANVRSWLQLKMPGGKGKKRQLCFHCAFETSKVCENIKKCRAWSRAAGDAKGQRLHIDLASKEWIEYPKEDWKPLIAFQNEWPEWIQPSEHMLKLVPTGWKDKTS